MPFRKHIIEPVKISQNKIPSNEKNVLECCSNLTLVNVIRQLASLSQHATLIFENLTQEAKLISERSIKANHRIEKLKDVCSKLDMNTELVDRFNPEHFNKLKHFKNSDQSDQDVFGKHTMPEILRILYDKAEPPPDLEQFTIHRDDKISAMKIYSDPSFFYNNWKRNVIKIKKERKKSKKEQNIASNRNELEQKVEIKDNIPIEPELQNAQNDSVSSKDDKPGYINESVLLDNNKEDDYLVYSKEYSSSLNLNQISDLTQNKTLTNRDSVHHIMDVSKDSFSDDDEWD